MNIQIEDVGPCRKQLTIEFPQEKVTEAFAEVVGGYARYARVPGFRPGKAPADLVKRRFHKDIVKEVKEHLIPRGYHEAINKEKVRPVQVIDVTETDPKEGQPFGFQITVDVVPDFAVPDYKSIKVEAAPVVVTEESIDEVVDRMRDRMANFVDAGARAARASDRVTVNYTATVDGQPMQDMVKEHGILAKAENFGVILDPEYSFIPEFAEGLVGIAAGETRAIKVHFNDQFIETALAGKDAEYTVEALKVEEKQLPELTPEFLKTIGAESVESMRTRIRQDLQRMKTDQESRRIQDEICKKLLDGTAMNLPESELQRRTADEVYDLVQYNSEKGIDRDVIEQNREQIFQAAGKVAEDKLKLRYILLAIAREEKLTISEADVEARVRMLAMQARKDPVKLRDELEKNNRLPMLRDDLLASRALAMIEHLQKPKGDAA